MEKIDFENLEKKVFSKNMKIFENLKNRKFSKNPKFSRSFSKKFKKIKNCVFKMLFSMIVSSKSAC